MPYVIKKSVKNTKRKRAALSKLVTFEEFYETVDEKTKADLLDGLIIRDSPAIPRHANIATWISALLRIFVDERDLGIVLGATATVRLSLYNAPEPDVLFISKNRLSMVNDKFIDGPPDLCIEVISKSSRKHDRGRKFVLYAEHGVREYWIFDPFKDTVEFFESHSGVFVHIQPDEQGRLHSHVLPGFWLKPEWLHGALLPSVPAVFEEIIGKARRLF